MPKRSEKRDAAKAEYLARKGRGELVDLRELAEGLGVNYQTLRNWKSADEWEKAEPKKKRGGQPGNRNSAGHKNAAGSHKGAPAGNHNAEKDGAYSTIFFDTLSEAERELVMNTPVGSRAALEHEMQILKFREHRILTKIIEYEQAPEDELYLNSVLDMRQPAGRGDKKIDGARQQMGMYSKDSAFARVLKLQDALYKVQGRIAKIADSLRALEELGEVLGRYDEEGLCTALERARSELTAAAEQAEREWERKGRMDQVLGLTAGAFLVILLI